MVWRLVYVVLSSVINVLCFVVFILKKEWMCCFGIIRECFGEIGNVL